MLIIASSRSLQVFFLESCQIVIFYFYPIVIMLLMFFVLYTEFLFVSVSASS